MIKLITRIVLSLCILLSSGYSQLYSHEMEENHPYAQTTELPGQETSSISSEHPVQLPIISTHISGNIKIDPTEIEEDDDVLFSFKKYVENSIYFSAIFCTLILGFLLKFIQRKLFLSKHFFHITSYRMHLLYQVFTI
ncbi:hypothetical protein [Algoriphagus sp.]|uniref:hypothetical protein n=1 Tax=Algoriphagus sp. TaxID=1872435 RepID=UPI0025CD27CE|nr:hypothetical protein [Algoriphagus sp.]